MQRILLALVLVICAACTNTALPALPTAVGLEAATLSPSPTPTASPTESPTLMASPTKSPTPEPTLTPLPTLTSTPAWPTQVPYLTDPIVPETAKDVREVGLWGKGVFIHMDVAERGKAVAVATHVGVRVYDSTSLEELVSIRTDTISMGMSISDDGTLLAGSRFPPFGEKVKQQFLNIWQVKEPAQVSSFAVKAEVSASAFSPDNSLVAVGMGSGPGSIGLYQAADGELVCEFSGHSGKISELIFADNGTRLYSIAADTKIRAWDVAGCSAVWAVETGLNLEHITLSGDGKVLAAIRKTEIDKDFQPVISVGNQKISFWKTQDGTPVDEVTGGEINLTQVGLDQKGTFIAAGDLNGNITIMDPNGKEKAGWQAQENKVLSLAFTNEGYVLSAGNEGLRLWDLSGAVIAKTEGYGSSITQLQISPDGRYLAARDPSGVKLWDTREGRMIGLLAGETPTFFVFDAHGQRMIVGWDKNYFSVLTVPGLEVIEKVELENPALVGEVSADGKYIAIGSDGAIDIFSADPIQPFLRLTTSENSLSIAFRLDGTMVAGGKGNGQIRVWSLPEGKRLVTLYKGDFFISQLIFSPDGKYLFSKMKPFQPNLWSTERWEYLRTYNGDGRVTFGTKTSPNFRLLFTSVRNFTNQLWDMDSEKVLNLFDLGTDICNDIVFSPDGSRIYAAGGFGVIYVYAIPK
jgi:WD40 repeat protein